MYEDAYIKTKKRLKESRNKEDEYIQEDFNINEAINIATGKLSATEDSLEELNKQLPKHETIKRFRILDRQFEQDQGEITPTMKLKRKVLYEKFKDTFEEMYAGLEDGAL